MKLTREQEAIIATTGNIKINAVAGSGKTTTIIEYARTRPAGSRILYLAFNKSVKLEATRKFADKGLQHVRVETAHSLAYRYVVAGSSYKVRQGDITTHELVQLLELPAGGEKHAEYILANHVMRFAAYFCNSNIQKVQQLNYRDVVNDAKALQFVNNYYKLIEAKTRLLLAKMNSGEIEITHDFYLKKFQLKAPQLPYDYILFDEAQDASPAMLDVFLNQQGTRVMVGDTHQQIYGWRFAVNSLEKASFQTLLLSTSFRFGQPIANLAMEVLAWKRHLGDYLPVTITGAGEAGTTTSHARLARTNLGLLKMAIDYVGESRKNESIYFEGNIHSYTYAADGASLYDVLNLYNGKRHMIRDPLIKSMKTLDDLEEYIQKTEDAQLATMLELVRDYGNELPGILKNIKSRHVSDADRAKASVIFSTIHRSKGLEYDTVELAADFVEEEKLEEGKSTDKSNDPAKLNEEINLLYVAITRARHKLIIPQQLLPKDYTSTHPSIEVKAPAYVPPVVPQYTYKPSHPKKAALETKPPKAYDVETVRQVHKEAYSPWTPEQDDELTVMYCEGKSLKTMAQHFGRTKGAIMSRIKKLNLHDLYD
jgi:superfamily I DNA/RNA helicase